MIENIRSHKEGLGVWWAGYNSWIIKSGDIVVATGLYLENNSCLNLAPITPEEFASEIDISFVTHAHGDHFNEYTSGILLENRHACLYYQKAACCGKFEVKGIQVSVLRAIHLQRIKDYWHDFEINVVIRLQLTDYPF
jgi:L-ascorbate metabolism protein UlaG (beta-lactamase superfamily)